MKSGRLHSNLAAVRTQMGITQESLATRAGVSRQALGLVETERSVPSTALALRLASLLGRRVEDLFTLDETSAEIAVTWVDPVIPPPDTSNHLPSRGRLGYVQDRWVAHELDPRDVGAADILRTALAAGRRAPLPPGLDPEALRRRLLISGCAPALGVLVEHLRRGPDPVEAVWIHATTESALAQLGHGETHVAGVHFVAEDRQPGRREGRRHTLTLARWRQGLLVRRDRRSAPRVIEDLARRGIRVAKRESGASANRLLDKVLRKAGVRFRGETVEA